MFAKAIMILLIITLPAPWASAQSTFGDVVGVVKDQNQGGVPGAQVLLTSIDDGSQRSAIIYGQAGNLLKVFGV